MDASRVGLRDPRSPGGVMGDPHGARKSESTWTDEDDIDRDKWDRGIKGLAEPGHSMTSRRSCSGQAEMDSLEIKACRFFGLGLKTGGTFSAAGRWRWKARGVIMKLASR
jgi:hypothetical protein